MTYNSNKNYSETESLNPTLEEIFLKLGISNEEKTNLAKKLEGIHSDQLVKKILELNINQKSNKDFALYVISYDNAERFKEFGPLKNDIDVVIAALSASINNYNYISENLKQNTEIGKIMITTYIKENYDYEYILRYINKNFGEDKNQKNILENHYKSILKKTENYVEKDLQITLFELHENHKEFIDELLTKKIIIIQENKINISKEFYKKISLKISSDNYYLGLSNQEKEKYLFNLIISELQIPNNIPTQQVKYLVGLVVKGINVTENKLKVEKKQDTKIEDNKKTNLTENNVLQKENILGGDLNNDNTYIIGYSLQNHNYSLYNGYYHVNISGDKNVEIKENELENFTSEALSNFVKFYALLDNIGLNFLWDKHEDKFKTLCSNKVGFDYQKGEGITEGKSLAILNVIGKSIGVPEDKTVIYNADTDGENKQIKTPKCFKTLADANMKFGEINSSGIINNQRVMEPGTFSNYSIVEKFMMQNDLINAKSGNLDLSKFG